MAASQTFQTNGYGSMRATGGNTVTITGEATLNAEPTVPAAKSATLTTRTNSTSGTLTMTTGHGYTTGDRCDIYWDNADGTEGACFGAVLGTVSAAPADTAVPIASVAGGDALPPAASAVVICKCVEVPLAFDGADLKAVGAASPSARAYFVFNDGSYNVYDVYLSQGGYSFWHNQLADTNPLTGDSPVRVFVSHNEVNRAINNAVASVMTGD